MGLSVGRKSLKVTKGTIHGTSIPPKDEKPSINGYRDMVRKRNIRRQMKFQDGRLPGVQLNPKKNRPAHFHPETTIKIW
jgi:hypothetical protein